MNELLNFFGSLNQEFRDVIYAMAVLGISIDDFQYNRVNILSSEPLCTIKFSIPESWEIDILGDNELVNANDVKQQFKEGMNKALTVMWKNIDEENDDIFEDSFYDTVTESIKYMCRTRKGVIWTIKDRDASIAKTKTGFNKIDELIQQRQDYDEV